MKAYLVLGAESTGTRLLTKILIAAGCRGEATHQQAFDSEILPPPDVPLVWRRSVPHGKQMPDVPCLIQILREAGYSEVQVVVTTRSWHCAAKSHIESLHSETYEDAIEKLRAAYLYIFRHLAETNVPFVMVTYKNLVTTPAAVCEVLKMLGLPPLTEQKVKEIGLYDGNEKYYSSMA